MSELEQQIDELYSLYQGIKSEIRRLDKHLFERWKVFGYIIDEDIMTGGYPNLSMCLEKLKDKGLLEDSPYVNEYDEYRPLGESDLGPNYWE